VKIIQVSTSVVFTMLAVLLCANCKCTAQTRALSSSSTIEILPESGSLDLNSSGSMAMPREASTAVRMLVTSAKAFPSRPIDVFAYLTTDTGMKATGRARPLAMGNLRIRNDRGVWTTPAPLAELGGRPGVRIATAYGASATIMLRVQLNIPASQAPGSYRGVLVLQAQERQ
jgi:hypothetical protein